MNGHLKAATYAFVGAVVSAEVARFTGACPGLVAALPAIATALFGSLVTYYMRRPLTAAFGKVTLAGALAFAGGTLLEQLKLTCGADFVQQAPTLAVSALWVAVGLYLRAPHENPSLGSVTPPALKPPTK